MLALRKSASIKGPLIIVIWFCFFSLIIYDISFSEQISDQFSDSIVIGGNYDYPPYEFIDENGKPSGYTTELTKAIAEVMGVKVKIILDAWPTTRDKLETGTIDGIQGMYYSKERDRLVDFSPPHAIVYSTFFSRKELPNISAIEELKHKKIVVVQKGALHDYIKSKGFNQIIVADSDGAALRLVASGQYDYALIGRLPGIYLTRKLKLTNIRVLGPSILPFKYCFAVKEGNDYLLGRINEGLSILKQTGRYQAIYDKWIGVLEPETDLKATILKFLVIPIIIGAVIMIWAFFWVKILRKQVAARTSELKSSEEQYRDLFENMVQGAFYQSRDGELKDVNSAALEILGLSYDQFVGKTSKDPQWRVVHEDGTDFTREDHPSMVSFKTGKACRDVVAGIYNVKKKDHTWVTINAVPQFKKGEKRPYQVFITMHDITGIRRAEEERIKLESMLRQSQKMESIGTLAGGIAHDFNNILSPIMGHAEMLLDDIPEESFLREGLKEIFTGAMRARDLVKQILTFSRIERQEFKTMKIQPIILEAMTLIRSTIPTTIKITQDISNDCGVINANPTEIHQIVMNLATNSYHAMVDNVGELKVTLKELTLGEQDVIGLDFKPGVYACLSMADTGIGMDDYTRDKVFEPFFTTKELGKGTGMGLSVIHGIVKNAGGGINIYSEIGKGTKFCVYLPVVKSSSEQHELQTKEIIHGGTEKILIVDDENSILNMEKQMLERLGYQVVSFNSSLEALETFRVTPDKFDMVITDMAMPNMSGDKLAAELVKIRPDIPILLCTGFSEHIPEAKALAIGFKGFLLKPIVLADLSRKIREVLDL